MWKIAWTISRTACIRKFFLHYVQPWKHGKRKYFIPSGIIYYKRTCADWDWFHDQMFCCKAHTQRVACHCVIALRELPDRAESKTFSHIWRKRKHPPGVLDRGDTDGDVHGKGVDSAMVGNHAPGVPMQPQLALRQDWGREHWDGSGNSCRFRENRREGTVTRNSDSLPSSVNQQTANQGIKKIWSRKWSRRMLSVASVRLASAER